MLKKFICFAVLMVLLMGMVAGCGTKKAETVKIGFIGPLTGGNAAIGDRKSVV